MVIRQAHLPVIILSESDFDCVGETYRRLAEIYNGPRCTCEISFPAVRLKEVNAIFDQIIFDFGIKEVEFEFSPQETRQH